LLLDLFCGRGGWTIPALSSGWNCVGVDVADHGYPGFLIRESLPWPARRIREIGCDLVVASPPCEEFARRWLPWLQKDRPDELAAAVGLLRWAISLQGEVGCPVVVECSRISGKYAAGAFYHPSYCLWGDVPALMPQLRRRKESMTGEDPASRAMVEADLAEWILSVHRPREAVPACA
jgi:hypothetical protein